MRAEVLLGQPDTPPSISSALCHFAHEQKLQQVDLAFAYVSLAGLRECVGEAEREEAFRRAKKLWVVGIHNGISEPRALEEILASPSSSVRLLSPTRRIDRAALAAAEKLHAKAIHLVAPRNSLMIVGSANLTRAAIGRKCTNYEADIALHLSRRDRPQECKKEFRQWFRRIWKLSIPVTTRVISQYAAIRQEFVERHPVVIPRLDQHPADRAGRADHLWIEAGAMSGAVRHQVEFGPHLASFFGPLRRRRRKTRIKYGAHLREDRPLSFKITKWDTEIWRLGLFTPSQGGPGYPGKMIHFTRCRDQSGEFFLLEVAGTGSAQAAKWRGLAHRKGTVAETGSGGPGRAYGIY